MVESYVMECNTCNEHHPKQLHQCSKGRFPILDASFKDIQIDFTDMRGDQRTTRILISSCDGGQTKWDMKL